MTAQASRDPSQATADAQQPIEASFEVDPGTRPGDPVTLKRLSGSPNITLDAAGDLKIRWPKNVTVAELFFEIAADKQSKVDFDGIFVGLDREGLITGIRLPISVECTVALPRRILELALRRESWRRSAFPTYSVDFRFKSREGRWGHDPKIYNEGPDSEEPESAGSGEG